MKPNGEVESNSVYTDTQGNQVINGVKNPTNSGSSLPFLSPIDMLLPPLLPGQSNDQRVRPQTSAPSIKPFVAPVTKPTIAPVTSTSKTTTRLTTTKAPIKITTRETSRVSTRATPRPSLNRPSSSQGGFISGAYRPTGNTGKYVHDNSGQYKPHDNLGQYKPDTRGQWRGN